MSEPDEVHKNISESADKIRDRIQADKPWRDSELVNYLYHSEEMSGPEIADKLGCSVKPIYERIDDTRSFGEANRVWQLKEPAQFSTSESGYERVGTKIDGHQHSIAVHRLVMIAHKGVDAVKGSVIHHKNGVPWDNRPANLRIMSQSEHVREHFGEIPINDKLAMVEMSITTPATHEVIGEIKGYSRSTVCSVVARAKRGDADE